MTPISKPPGARCSARILPGDDDAGFLRETFQGFKGFRIFLQRADALDDARAVAKNGEEKLAGFAKVIEPAANRDFLPVVFACIVRW